MDVLPELTLRELVNYGMPLIPAARCALPADGIGHSPTMAEKIENDDPSWGDEWHEKHQVAERREVMLEGMV